MLPQYSKQYKSEDIDLEDGANEPFLARTSTETAPPTYPPSSSGSGARSNVQYSYEPVYPRKGDTKIAVGLMGRSKAETIEIVQRGFSDLSEYDPDRISFKDGDGAIIFEEAWEHFGSNPPAKLKIIVEDGPGEKEKRDRREKIILCSAIGVIVFLIALAVTLSILVPDPTK